MKSSKVIIIVVLVVIVAGVAAVALTRNKKAPATSSTPPPTTSSSSTTSTSTNSSSTATDSVTIQNFAFSPASITVKVGTKVTWTNKDGVSHSITADTASAYAPDGQLFGQNQTFSFTFSKAGTYTYHCTPHPYMHGTVVVTN